MISRLKYISMPFEIIKKKKLRAMFEVDVARTN